MSKREGKAAACEQRGGWWTVDPAQGAERRAPREVKSCLSQRMVRTQPGSSGTSWSPVLGKGVVGGVSN